MEPERPVLLWQIADLIGHLATERIWWGLLDPGWVEAERAWAEHNGVEAVWHVPAH